MPWFNPQPSELQVDNWKYPNSQPHKVAKWPHPNSNRTNSRFRLLHTKGLFPTASRWTMSVQALNAPGPDPPADLYRAAWTDQEYAFGSILSASVPDDGSGWEMFMVIETREFLASLNVAGVEIQTGVQHPTFGSYGQIEEWPAYGTQPLFPSWNNRLNPAVDFMSFASPEWPWPLTFIDYAAASDCFAYDSFLLP